MPVKVQCPSCSKVLNAPDAARGKSVKCPGCETKIAVPAGDGAAGKPAAGKPKTSAKKSADDDDFLGGLDISAAATADAEICPKCGADLPEGATECPKCGVDPNTGQLSAAAKKRKTMKGPDPAEYYGAVWKDGWAFMGTNYRLALKTVFIFTVFNLLAGGCGFMVNWCSDGPPKAFWAFCALLCNLILPGWHWHVIMETIAATIVKRKAYVADDIKFDAITCIALGIRFVLWMIVVTLLPPLVIGPLMFPIAMVHMCMPVSTKAWIWPTMLPAFFRNLGGTLYYFICVFIANLPYLGILALAAVLSAGPFKPTIDALQQSDQAALKDTTTWVRLGILLTLTLVSFVFYGFILLFQARATGLFAYYFKERLDLTTFVEDKKYVKKERPVDKFGKPIKTTGQKVMGAVLSIVVLAVIAGAGYFVYIRVFKGP